MINDVKNGTVIYPQNLGFGLAFGIQINLPSRAIITPNNGVTAGFSGKQILLRI